MKESQFSQREKEVIDLLLQGKSNKQIALTLHIAQSTVEYHLKNIYQKLDVHSRTEAVLRLGKSIGADLPGKLRDSIVETDRKDIHNDGISHVMRRFPMNQKSLVIVGLFVLIFSLVAVSIFRRMPAQTTAEITPTSVLAPTAVPATDTPLAPTPIPISQPIFSVEEIPAYDAFIQQDPDWVGADGGYSIALSDAVTLWLFGDSIIGDVSDGKRVNTKRFARNSIAIQQGKDPSTAIIDFYWGPPDQTGDPTPFIEPDDGRGWFWFADGVLTPEGLYLFLMHMDTDTSAGESIFGFKHVGSTLAHVANPHDHPTAWRITQYQIPWARFEPHHSLMFGAALLQDGGYIYIYGFDEEPSDFGHQSHMVLARTSKNNLADFNQWEFYSNGQWQSDWQQTTRLFPDIGVEYSVSYQESLQQYVVVYWDTACCFSGKMLFRHASTSYGPWSEPLTIFVCPEKDWRPNTFCYGAKAHPELSTAPNELVVTYVANSDFAQLFADARLYWPRFLRIKFGSP